MADENIGRGIGAQYDVLTITDGMTAAELIAVLSKFPPTAKIGASNGKLGQEVEEKNVRMPIAVYQGGLPNG